MKSIQVFSSRVRFLALVALGAANAGLSPAQTISFYGVEKRITYKQTSSAVPVTPSTTINDPNGPYFLDVNVSGANLNLLASVPTLTGSFTASPITLEADGTSRYGFTGNNPAQKNFSTKGTLDTAYPNGSFTLNNLPGSITLDLGISDAYPAGIPAITNSTWSGSALQVNAATGMTLNFSSFPGYGTGGMIGFNLYTTSGGNISGELDNVMSLSFSDPALTSYSIGPGILTAGQTYFGELSFGSFTDTDNTISGALGYALFVDMTGFSISAVPEPSTYAVVTGLFALGIVFWRRRFTGCDA